jgi:hypothetical protein
LESHGDTTAADLAEKLDLNKNTIRKNLGKLLSEKKLTRSDEKPAVYNIYRNGTVVELKPEPKKPKKVDPRYLIKTTIRKITCLQCRHTFQLTSRQEDREFCDASCEIRFNEKLRRKRDLERWEAARSEHKKPKTHAEPHFNCVVCGLPFGGRANDKLCNKCDRIRQGLL